jgi:hypothetical protein
MHQRMGFGMARSMTKWEHPIVLVFRCLGYAKNPWKTWPDAASMSRDRRLILVNQNRRGGDAMADHRVRYMVEAGSPFSIHADGLLIQAVTRKSEIPVTVEFEGLSRRMLLQFQAAIEQELARREVAWKQERKRVLKVHANVAVGEEPVDEPTIADEFPRPAA